MAAAATSFAFRSGSSSTLSSNLLLLAAVIRALDLACIVLIEGGPVSASSDSEDVDMRKVVDEVSQRDYGIKTELQHKDKTEDNPVNKCQKCSKIFFKNIFGNEKKKFNCKAKTNICKSCDNEIVTLYTCPHPPCSTKRFKTVKALNEHLITGHSPNENIADLRYQKPNFEASKKGQVRFS